MRSYLVVLLMLSGCSYDATLVPRGGGETLKGVYNRAGLSMTVPFEGAEYTGRVVQGQSVGVGFTGTKSMAMVGAANQFASTMLGPKGAIRCEFALGGTGGNGLCQAPDGRTYDLVLEQ